MFGLSLSLGAAKAATEGKILAPDSVDPADSGKHAGELAVFESVGQGIQLSLANCSDRSDCEPVLSEDELATLIQTLDARIEQLNAAEPESEREVDRLINKYRQTRQQYALYMEELRDIQRDIREMADEEVPAARPADDIQAESAPESKPEPEPKLEQSARKDPVPEPKASTKPQYENEEFSLDQFEDADEPIRSE